MHRRHCVKSDIWDLWYLRGIGHGMLNQHQEAILDFTRALQLQPDAWDARAARAQAYLSTRQWSRAVADCSEVLKRSPGDVPSLKIRLQAYQQLRESAKVIADATEVMQLRPDDAEVPARRGHAFRLLGWLDEAFADFDRALQLRTDIWWYWSGRADVHAQRQEWGRAASDYAHATSLAPPEEFRAWLKQGTVQLELDHPAAYRDLCAKWLHRLEEEKYAPLTLEIVWACVAVPDAISDPGEVLHLAEKAAALDRKNGSARRVLGGALYRAGQYQPAIEHLNAAVRCGEEDTPEAWLLLAMAHQRAGHADTARQCLEKARGFLGRPTVAEAWDRDPPCDRLRREAEALVQP